VVLVLRDVSEPTDWEGEVIHARKQLEEIVDTLSAAIFLKDTDGRYLLMNDRCREILGVSRSETVVGMTDEELFDEAVASRVWANDRRVFETGETVEFEETVPTVDGERTMLTRKTPITDETGSPYALCGVSTDITGQKERERALKERVKELSAIHRTVGCSKRKVSRQRQSSKSSSRPSPSPSSTQNVPRLPSSTDRCR